MIRHRNRPGRAAADAVALLAVLAHYWLRIYPTARSELKRWQCFAEAIPDPILRRTASVSLGDEGLNAEGAALFAILAPAPLRQEVVRVLVRFQIMYDYLDALTEQPADDLLASSRRLHCSLDAALGARGPTGSFYSLHPHRDDGGYLDTLAAGVRAGVARLPRADVVRPYALDVVRRSAEAQSHSHAAVFVGREDLVAWARAETPPELDLDWWETAAAAESSLVVHALIASAADPALTDNEARAILAAYWPWITGLNALLDDLVDVREDASEGTHSYLGSYGSSAAIRDRLQLFTRHASTNVRNLPLARRHAIILAAMASFYLTTPGATSSVAQPVARAVICELDIDVRVLLSMLRARRRAQVARLRPHRARRRRRRGPRSDHCSSRPSSFK